MRRLPWRSTVRADRRSIVTALTVSLVTAFALAGFALAGALDGEEISAGGRFADQDRLVPASGVQDPLLVVTLAELPMRSGGILPITLLDGPLAPAVPPGQAWTSELDPPMELELEDGTRLGVVQVIPMPHVPRTRYLVAHEDAIRALPELPPAAYALVAATGQGEQGGAPVPGVEPFLAASSKEVSRDLVLVVVFASALVALFSYELIRSEIRERRRELAVWRALGMRRSEVILLVLARGGAMSAAAGMVGIALTILMLRGLRTILGIDALGGPTLAPTGAVLAAVIMAGVLGSIVPAYLAGKIQVREAMEAST